MIRHARLLLFLVIAGCSSLADLDQSSTPSLALLMASERSICWAGMCVGDTRSQIEARIGMRLRPKEDYTDACGGYFAHPTIAGREVMLEFSSARPEGKLEVIGVPLSETERRMTPQELSRAARSVIPDLVDGTAIEYGTPEQADPLYLTVAGRPEVGVNIKPDAPEQYFFVTDAGCID